MCPKHGGPFAECEDPEIDWFPQRVVCYPAMQSAAVNAMYDDLHEKRPYHDGLFKVFGEKRSAMTPFHVREGVSIFVSREDYSPDDDFLGQSLAQESPGDIAEPNGPSDDHRQSG